MRAGCYRFCRHFLLHQRDFVILALIIRGERVSLLLEQKKVKSYGRRNAGHLYTL